MALTFDDGPDPVYTPRVLRVLRKYHASATFFMIGSAARRYPFIVKEVVRQGHEIGNHTWDHANLMRIRSRARRMKQMWECAKATAPYGAHLFRPPFGAKNDKVKIDAFLFGYKVVLWNVSAQDWLPQKAENICQKILNGATPGSIFLLHDSIVEKTEDKAFERETMIEGLDRALAVLKRRIRFVTVSELLHFGPPASNWPHVE